MKRYKHDHIGWVEVCGYHARIPPPRNVLGLIYDHTSVLQECLAETAAVFAYFPFALRCPPQVMKAIALRTWWSHVRKSFGGTLQFYVHLPMTPSAFPQCTYATWTKCPWLGLE
jgi:hypothetical protein